MAVIIFSVSKNSPAEKKNIYAGEKLISINGNDIIDVLDYRFYQLSNFLTLIIEDKNAVQRTVEIKKREYDEIGLEFETYLMDEQKRCKNNCIFCFIDQLPKGLRGSLYFKDDDSRLSFLFGNYITLTNLTSHETDRIIQMHISPINVSVHTTNPDLRDKMMRSKNAGKSLAILKKFSEFNIQINCQIVLCPGVNDKAELYRTFEDLEKLEVQTVSVVPVGLTKHREKLYHIEPFTKKTAAEVLKQVESFAEKCKLKYNRRIFYAADEFYIKAEQDIPPADFYEDFAALENGVGLIALLIEETESALEKLQPDNTIQHKVTLACGVSSAPYLRNLAEKINKKFPSIEIQVCSIINKFFGESINVSGLVCGNDLINQLTGCELGSKLLIPAVMLRYEGDIFLDDVSVSDVSAKLSIPVIAVQPNGDALVDAVINL